MKKLLLFTIILFSFSVAFSQTKVIVTTKEANVRAEPNLQSAVVGKVKYKAVLTATANQGNWSYITFGKIRGWIHSSTITLQIVDNSPDLSDFVIKQNVNKTRKNRSTFIDYSQKYENEWTYYGISNGKKYFYNAGRASLSGYSVRIWTQTKDVLDDEVISKDLAEVDCAGKRFRLLAGVTYYKFTEYSGGQNARRKISPDSYETPSAVFGVIFPDSVAEVLANIVCKL